MLGLSAGVTEDTIRVGWGAVSGALHYQVQHRTIDTTTWTLTDNAQPGQTLSGLQGGTTYLIRVRAVGRSDVTGPWSAITRATTTQSTHTVTVPAETILSTSAVVEIRASPEPGHGLLQPEPGRDDYRGQRPA